VLGKAGGGSFGSDEGIWKGHVGEEETHKRGSQGPTDRQQMEGTGLGE